MWAPILSLQEFLHLSVNRMPEEEASPWHGWGHMSPERWDTEYTTDHGQTTYEGRSLAHNLPRKPASSLH